MDNELFELCKEVYEKTGWGTLRPSKDTHYFVTDDTGDTTTVPMYDSDYLFGKLPRVVTRKDISWFLNISSEATTSTWVADYQYWDHISEQDYYLFENIKTGEARIHADTPLKALLKLTLALHKAGELK
jgi:hypothetical protein